MDNGDTYDITVKDESNVRINNRLLSDGGTVKIEDLAWSVTVNADKDHTIVNMQHAIGSSSLLPTSSSSYAMNYDLDNTNGTLAAEVSRDGNRERRRVGKCVKVA